MVRALEVSVGVSKDSTVGGGSNNNNVFKLAGSRDVDVISCGKTMHRCMSGRDHTPLRCSGYAHCRTYLKQPKPGLYIFGASIQGTNVK